MLKRLFLFCVLCVSALNAANFYVATNGNNGAAGTIGAPFETIRHGVAVMAGGDTLYLRGGTHASDGFYLEIAGKSGTPTNFTFIRGYPGERAIYAPTVSNHGIQLLDVTNFALCDFEIDGSGASYDVVKLTSDGGNLGGFILISNMSIYAMPRGHGILTSGLDPAKWTVISRCQFYTNGWAGDGVPDASPLHQIYIQDSNVTVEYSYFHGTTNHLGGTTGIQLSNSGCTNQIYRNNVFTNCFGQSISCLSFEGDAQIYNNIILGSIAVGMEIRLSGRPSYVMNNSQYGGANGFIIDRSTNLFLENNIVTHAFPDSRGVVYITTSSNVFVRNNLVCSNLNALHADYRTNVNNSAVTYADNLIAVTMWHTNEIYNPKLAAPTVGNLRLQRGSSASEAGRAQTLFTDDYDGKTRTGLWDIGAFNLTLESQIHAVNANVGSIVIVP